MVKKLIRKIQLGTFLAGIINVLTFGQGKHLSKWIAVDLLGFKSCGCCEREEWLNRLTNPDFDGECDGIKIN